MKKFNVMALAAALLFGAVAVAEAGMPIAGNAAGGGHPNFITNKDGRQIDGGNDVNNDWTVGNVNLANTTSTAIKAAAGATKKICVRMLVASVISTTVATQLTLLDGATVKFTYNILAGTQPPAFLFPVPICGTANTAMNVKLGTTPTGAIDVDAAGFIVTN